MSNKPQTAEERAEVMRRFSQRLTNAAHNHAAWLAIVKHGLDTLLDDQKLLIEIVVKEAEREHARDKQKSFAEHVARIMQELHLQFEVTPAKV